MIALVEDTKETLHLVHLGRARDSAAQQKVLTINLVQTVGRYENEEDDEESEEAEEDLEGRYDSQESFGDD